MYLRTKIANPFRVLILIVSTAIAGLFAFSLSAFAAGVTTSEFAANDSTATSINVAVTGVTTGTVQTEYTFVASVTPVTLTLPITYVWQVTNHDTITQSNNLSDSLALSWNTAGYKTITVTVSNVEGSGSSAHSLTIYVPPSSLTISGPDAGVIGNSYTFTAAVLPPTTSLPIAYTWQATEQTTVNHPAGDLDDEVAFTWNTPGVKSITVTAANAAGSETAYHTITVNVPPAGVSISGPASGVTGTDYHFTATVTPPSASQPITYTWEATDHAPVIQSSGLSDTFTFNWDGPGNKTITVTANNVAGTVVDSHNLTIYAAPLDVSLSGPAAGVIDEEYDFTAVITPSSASQPVTYVWQATDQSTITETNGLSNTISLNWETPGAKVVTVTATNAAGSVVETHNLVIHAGPSTVALSGPAIGVEGIAYQFTAAVSPAFVTQPITYIWIVSGHPPVTYTDGLTNTASFNWSESGAQTVTVVAANVVGVVTATHFIEINAPFIEVYVTGTASGAVGVVYTFTATTNPNAQRPITYTWQATGQEPVVHGNLDIRTDSITFTWPIGGLKQVTVVVQNSEDSDEATHSILIAPVHIYLPVVTIVETLPPPEWEQLGTFAQETRSVAVCESDPDRIYVGTTAGLHERQAGTWNYIGQITGEVRGITFIEADNCNRVYAVALGGGVWQRQNDGSWQRVDNGSLTTARAVVVRGNQVFVGSSFGVFYANMQNGGVHSWQATSITGLVTNLSLQSGQTRIFAAVWTIGVQYNDSCVPNSCVWTSTPSPVDDFILDVIGAGDSPLPSLLATTSAVYRWTGSGWGSTATLSGQTFTLAQGEGKLFVGQESTGVRFSENGTNWESLGNLQVTVRDLFYSGGRLYAATTNGVWVWQLQSD